MLEHDQAEVIEIEVERGSVLIDRDISTAMTDLPEDVVIGAISRSGALITPRGETIVEPGDHVIVFVDGSVVDEVLDAI